MNAEATLLEDKNTGAQAARILVVEDERIVARSLQKQLTTLGYVVVACVPSGEEAIQRAGELLPDVVLMDINLEGTMDGVEAAASIRTRFQLPVVYLTAYSNKEILERARITAPFGYILKPYEERELHVVIEMALYKHRMERRQQERNQWFVATLKSIGDGVVAIDEEGRITYMNPVAEHLTGWVIQDARGQALNGVVRLIDQDSRQPVEFSCDRHIQNDRPSAGALLISKHGSEAAIDTSVSLIADEQGRALGRVVVFRDVTWRNQMEHRLRQAKKMEAIGQLAGGLGHAFNNLMTVVLGHNEAVLQSAGPGNPHFTSAQEIQRSAMRAVVITQRLMAFGRKQILTLGSVDINALVHRLAEVLRHMHRSVSLDLRLAPNLASTKADADQLEEAILTMVRNACEAMPEGGRLIIQTENIVLGQEFTQAHAEVLPGPYVLLTVSDTGVGMDQEVIRHLFEPFYTKKARVGAGLGLAAAYGFVKQCGGEIDVVSQPSAGTTFQIYLPST